ncbi:ABC transporter permease [Solibacillus sp. CAU 1738]|uniref:ABC transporter permease n=1 Tax=Solibacillus sp. CAU 1738 TaxID=3140363 RepID=UPI00326173A8
MKAVFLTRLIRLKKEWKSILFWFVFPFIMTVIVMQTIGAVQESTNIPIGVVLEEETELATELVENLEQTSNIQLQYLSLHSALYKLEKYELDSVIVIKKGFEDKLKTGYRNQVIKMYSTDRSIAPFTTVETVSSYVQDQASRYKAVGEIQKLYTKNNVQEVVDAEEIIEKSKKRLEEKDLITPMFQFSTDSYVVSSEQTALLNVWGVWALFSMLATFFIFDWIIKENTKAIAVRWLYTTVTFRWYSLWNLFLYILLIVAANVLSVLLLTIVLDVMIRPQFLFVIIIFSVTISMVSFVIAYRFTKPFFYYVTSILLSLLLAVLGGSFVPIDGLTRRFEGVQYLSPVHALLLEKPNWLWLICIAAILFVSVWRGGRSHASS